LPALKGTSSVSATVTGSSGLNALTFDKAGNVYISDSFQGIIWRTGPTGGAATVWAQDPLLTTIGVPPFGANGIEFNNERTILYVANTGNDQIIQIPVTNGQSNNPIAGKASVLVNSINGADGIVIDAHDNIWVAANQADEIVVIDKTGKVIAKLGDFNGVDEDGVPHGLLFPASPAFSPDGKNHLCDEPRARSKAGHRLSSIPNRRFAMGGFGAALHRLEAARGHSAAAGWRGGSGLEQQDQRGLASIIARAAAIASSSAR